MAVDLNHLWRKDPAPFAQIRWHLTQWILRRLWLLNWLGGRLTIFDAFQAPGDTLLTAIVARHLHQLYPRIRLNCLTLNPDILEKDPNFESVNERESYFCFPHFYPELVEYKDGQTNVLEPTFSRLGIANYSYEATVYLEPAEIRKAGELLAGYARPLITINVASKEKVKTWPLDYWLSILPELQRMGTVVQMGDDREPHLEGVVRLAGKLSRRQSMAALSFASIHIGPDSFLMHAANGLGVPSVILFGGSRTPANLGYAGNINLYTPMDCSPCWLHDSQGDVCSHEVECMRRIPPELVIQSARELLGRMKPGA